MAIVRWNPFQEIDVLQRQMNRLFDRMMSIDDRDRLGTAMGDDISFMPAAEIQEMPNEIKLRMELPGIEAQDLDVQVAAEAVSISGERKFESQSEERGTRRSEIRYGKFQRIIPLPASVQNDKVQAEFKNGVLCLTMPKSEAEKNRVVKVSLNGQSQSSQDRLQSENGGQPATGEQSTASAQPAASPQSAN